MSVILTPAQAERLRQLGPLPPDWIITDGPPARWLLDKPWPPQVTVPAPPCWQCLAKGRP